VTYQHHQDIDLTKTKILLGAVDGQAQFKAAG
jgi:hypothetical protein